MTFLRTVTFDRAEMASHGTALSRLRADAIQAVVVRNVFTASESSRIVSEIEANAQDFPTTSFPAPFRSHFYGMNLNLADPDLEAYFSMAPGFSESLAALMAPHGGFESRVMAVLSAIDGGRSYTAPPGPPGAVPYMVTTLRSHHEGGYIPPHFDNEQRMRPSYRHLESLIEGDTFSFVLTLSKAERGGMLEVFDAPSEAWSSRFQNRDRTAAKPDLAAFARHAFDVEAGTLVLLRSGRMLHHVTPVAGGTKRWTACSFMAASRAGDGVYCWG
ncbi:2OG-Fe(II) oxygenase [Methylobacterium sp. WL9]|uniref:2OG-Fe(II) oxygenase n=1 Tax=Methylobacterium sp. WL9 TaxID=2603898 RepID=UPI0011CBA738|nr:2OG-Fe(II) oxygenase [Methylobacterium sp. WL9]TXN19865.1 2OG-Fe(II) oxygenase [Methylobacterium sp. WL9]